VWIHQKGNAAGRAQFGGADVQTWNDGEGEEGEEEEEVVAVRDHINELGMPNDGYDYSRHLKPIGKWIEV
jgi:hypothetical protein